MVIFQVVGEFHWFNSLQIRSPRSEDFLVVIALVHEALRALGFCFLGRLLTELPYTVFFFSKMLCTKCFVFWFMFLTLFDTKLYIPYTVNKLTISTFVHIHKFYIPKKVDHLRTLLD